MGITESIRVIDADSHVVEPYDLWTSRMSSKWGERVPHVVWNDEYGQDIWLSGDELIGLGAWAAHAGGKHWTPDYTPRWDEADPSATDPKLRLQLMDEYGIHAQLLYGNVLLLGAAVFAQGANSSEDVDFFLGVVRAYNDFLVDFASTDAQRFVPMMALPFWDIDLSIAEMHRAAGKGHRGLIFPQFPDAHGQPRLADTYWDRLWAAAQEAEISINFHIGSGGNPGRQHLPEAAGLGANETAHVMTQFMDNARTVAALTCGGVCERFPRLKFVSVESGCGWVPFALQALDWTWQNSAAYKEHPEYLLPSEYFRRQIYVCFFFEEGAPLDAAIEFIGADSILYETDYPHPACMSPGPTLPAAVAPKQYIQEKLGHLPDATLRKILHDNAASLYHLD
jgi:predicted TIM-barrel fold metal-dependent hydrolase